MSSSSDTTTSLIAETEAVLSKTSEAVVESTTSSLRQADKKLTKQAGALQNGLESVLGGKKRFWIEQDVDGRRLANNIIGWTAFGAAVHAWHRGIQKKPVFGPPLRPYAIALPVWALIGYYIHHFELRQEEVLAQRRLLLRRNRGLLEQKDFDEMNLGGAYKDQHEKKAKLMAALERGDSFVKPTFETSTSPKERIPDSEMTKKVKDLAKSGDMDVYGKKLNERLESFEKEFEKQGKASMPTISSSNSWVRSTWSTPEEAKKAYQRGILSHKESDPNLTESSSSTSSSSGFWTSLFGRKQKESTPTSGPNTSVNTMLNPRRMSDEEVEKLRVEMEKSGVHGYGPGTGGFPPKTT